MNTSLQCLRSLHPLGHLTAENIPGLVREDAEDVKEEIKESKAHPVGDPLGSGVRIKGFRCKGFRVLKG